ncbi:MAG TPA: hypothetical protein VK108_08015 [Pseudogracilibacillus sp.]|nr:hypothetical protein [Pseudogracilibacillus sp.]
MLLSQALVELTKTKNESKLDSMLIVASIITKLLEPKNIKPIIVGGLSVEIYTMGDYTTRDIDFVSDGYKEIEDLLYSLEFSKQGRHFYRDDIEIVIEIPDSYLAGSLEKVLKMKISDSRYVYVESVEDIILDRLRAAVHWKSAEDAVWGFTLMVKNFENIDVAYLKNHIESVQERAELENWIFRITKE